MKKLSIKLLAVAAMTLSLNASEPIVAVKTTKDLHSVSYKSAIWKYAKFTPVMLYPQTTLRFNDKRAKELNKNNTPIKAVIAAVYNDEYVSFMIKWPDRNRNQQQKGQVDIYSDAAAIQFASDYSDPKKLPYIGMGSKGRPVVIHLQKDSVRLYEPNAEGDVAHQVNPNQTIFFEKDLKAFNKEVTNLGHTDYERSFVSEGFRSMSEIKDGTSHSHTTIGYSGIGWWTTIARALKDDYVNLNGVIPVAFAVWNGDKMGRGGLKYLTPWIAVKLQSSESPLIEALHGEIEGDVANGHKIAVQSGCTGCHQVDPEFPENFMAPSLLNIGGYSTADYLRESLVDPEAVVVPGYNRNAHKRNAWYNYKDGKRVSMMPNYSWMPKSDLDDLVAYMKSLKSKEN